MRSLPSVAALWRAHLRPRWRLLPLAVQLASAGIVLMVAAFWCLSVFLERQEAAHESAEREVERLHRARVAALSLAGAVVDMESGKRGFMLHGDSAFLAPYVAGRRDVAAFADSLERLRIRDDAEAARLLDTLLVRIDAWRAESAEPDIVARLAPTWRADGVPLALLRARSRMGKQRMDTVRGASDAFVARLAALSAAAREAEREMGIQRRRDGMLARIAVAAAVLLVLVVWMRVVTRTLRRIVRAAEAVAVGDYDRATLDPEEGGNGETARLAAVFERVALAVAEREQILKSDIIQLRELERMKSAFVSTVSHELRTPLTSVRGALGLVLGGATGELAPRTRDLLRIAHQNAERLIRLINDILDIEKLESGHLALRREPAELGAIARTTVAALEAFAHEHGVGVVLDPPAGPVPVFADPDRLVQVATNLVSNAVKFSPRGSTVRVAVGVHGGAARLTVADRGPGIPAEFQSRIFGRFQQADDSGTRAHGGTGLGLAIVRSIVELHDGAVRFETAPGAGTTFIVELPLDDSAAVPLGESRTGERLLIVDADPGMRRVLEALCTPLADVVAVGSSEDGWRAASEGRFDAVVADPGAHADGIAFLRRLRTLARFDGVPVLVFSSRELGPSELEGIVLAPAHVFVKSRDRETDLVMRLRAALLARRASVDPPERSGTAAA